PSAGHEEFPRRHPQKLARQTERMSGGAAFQNVAAKDAQAGEAQIVGVARRAWPVARQPNRVGRKIDLDQVGDEDRRNVHAILVNRQLLAAADQQVDQRGQFGILGVLAEDLRVHGRQGAAVGVLVFQRDQSLIEERIALTRDLRVGDAADQVEEAATRAAALHGRYHAARGREYADGLLIAAEFTQGNAQGHQVYVEPTLRVFARIAQLQQVEDRLNISIEAVITLPGKRRVAVGERRDGLLGI